MGKFFSQEKIIGVACMLSCLMAPAVHAFDPGILEKAVRAEEKTLRARIGMAVRDTRAGPPYSNFVCHGSILRFPEGRS